MEAVNEPPKLRVNPQKWQDDKGWQGVKEHCRTQWAGFDGDKTAGKRSSDPCHCDYNAERVSCNLKSAKGAYPGNPIWQPPINPRTNEPYLTLAEWQADNPVKPQLRDMTEFEKGYVKCACQSSGDRDYCKAARKTCGSCECDLRSPEDKDGCRWTPSMPCWVAPQVPVDFSVEG